MTPGQLTNHCFYLVTKLCLTLCNRMDCGPLGSSVHGISQAEVLEWVAISSSRGSSQCKNQTCISCNGRQILYHWATRESESCSVMSNSLPPHESSGVRPSTVPVCIHLLFIKTVLITVNTYTVLTMKVKVTQSCLTLCDPMDYIVHGINSAGQNTGVGSLSLLQGIFPTQGSNPDLPHCRRFTVWATREALAEYTS